MDYHDAVRALAERGRYGIRLGLGRTRALLRELGEPQASLRGALVAGTNGKGSVLALASSAARAAGLRVGTTPKPHLVTYRERLQVDGRPISPDEFARLVSEVLPVADRVARRHGQPTEFELLTAVVFRWFADQRLDLALVEVGLGGRLDATHAWDGGVAVITNVDLDHTDRLGPTIAAIAREKAAIIERGDVAVSGATGEALALISRRARRLGVPLTVVEAPPVRSVGRDGLTLDLPRLGRSRIGLRGRHQAANAAVADALLDALEAAGIARVPAAARRAGYAAARWPGRLDLVTSGGHDLVIDGAHNPAGAAALAVALDDLRPHLRDAERRWTLVLAAMSDKDVAGILGALAGSAALREARVVATAVDATRALPPEALAAAGRAAVPGARPTAVVGAQAALERALRETDGPLVVAGSLYLAGEAHRRWLADPTLVDPVEVAA
jgi:dihydrofolate synthase/folylpolyglutamate synthase